MYRKFSFTGVKSRLSRLLLCAAKKSSCKLLSQFDHWDTSTGVLMYRNIGQAIHLV